jgi:hypothetical protein
MTTESLETLIRRASGADPLAPWSTSDAAELAAYTYGGTVFLRRDGEEPDAAERTALSVGLVMRLGSSGRIDGVALTAATGAVRAALSRGEDHEAAFGAGITTYEVVAERLRAERYSYAASLLVERVGMEPKTPWLPVENQRAVNIAASNAADRHLLSEAETPFIPPEPTT